MNFVLLKQIRLKSIVIRYRKHLPHILPDGAIFFVTFRLYGSIPFSKLKQLRHKYELALSQIPISNKDLMHQLDLKYEIAIEALMEQIESGPMYLSNPEIAEEIKTQMHKLDGKYYDLICYCVMSNHVHLLIDTSIQLLDIQPPLPLFKILKLIKGSTAIYANRVLKRSGQFWMTESYDRYMRDDRELDNTHSYILNNPVKANLVIQWNDWPYTYSKTGLD